MKKFSDIVKLNIAIALSACIAIYLDFIDSAIFYVLKPLTTILVICLPLSIKAWQFAFGHTLIVALCFCLLGDILLLWPSFFVFGLLAFLIGHLLFAKAIIKQTGFSRAPWVLLGLLGIGASIYLWLYPQLGTMRYPVAAYILVILFMAWQGVGTYIKRRTRPYLFFAIGAVLFVLSDSLIAINKFEIQFALAGPLILATYWLAITLVANAGVALFRQETKKL